MRHTLKSFLFLLVLSSSVNCLAQQDDNTKTQEQSAVTDVSVLIEKDMFRAKELKKELSRQRQMGEIQQDIKAAAESFKQFSSHLATGNLEALPSRHIQSLSKDINNLHRQAFALEKEITEYSNLVEEGIGELSQMKTLLEAVSAKDTSGLLQDAGDRRIDSLVIYLSSVKNTLNDSLFYLLRMRIELAETLSGITDLRLRIREVEEINLDKLVTRSRTNFFEEWRNSDKGEPWSGMAANMKFAITEIKDYILNRFLKNGLNYFIFFLIFFLTAALYIYYRNHQHKLSLSEIEAYLVSKPVAAGLFIFLLVTFWFDMGGNRPRVAGEFIGIAMLLPAIALMPKMLNDELLRRPTYFILIIFIINQWRGINIDNHLAHRTMMLFEQVVMLCGFAWMASPWGTAYRRSGFPYWKILTALLAIIIIAISLAILFNLYGIIALSSLITDGLVISIVAGTVLLLGAVILGHYTGILLMTPFANRLLMVRNNKWQIQHQLVAIFKFLAVVLGMYLVLRAFALWSRLVDFYEKIIDTTWSFGSLTISLGAVLAFALVLVVFNFIGKTVKFILLKELFPRMKMTTGAASASSTLVSYFILFAGFLMAIASTGIDITTIGFIGGALGVGIGFGLQNIVANFISGIILAFERPIQIGDVVQVGDLMGEVQRIGIRSSVVRTYNGSEVIVPNSDFISKEVVNWTLSDDKRRQELNIGVEYGSDPKQVIKIISGILDAHPKILKDPPSLVLFKAFGESSLDFRILFWVRRDFLEVQSEVNISMEQELKNASIGIPFPTRTLFIKDEKKEPSEDA